MPSRATFAPSGLKIFAESGLFLIAHGRLVQDGEQEAIRLQAMISTQSVTQSNEALPPRRKAQSAVYSVLLVATLCFGAFGAYALEEARAPSAPSLFPNHCRVLLMSGVPGDIESENS